jgi:hypothetical protein
MMEKKGSLLSFLSEKTERKTKKNHGKPRETSVTENDIRL